MAVILTTNIFSLFKHELRFLTVNYLLEKYEAIFLFLFGILVLAKGQLISKPIYDLLTSPKKRTDEFDLFAVKSKKANKSNSSNRFFGEVSKS